MSAGHAGRRDMTVRALRPFLALSFGLTWGIAALLVMFAEPIESVFGELSYTGPDTYSSPAESDPFDADGAAGGAVEHQPDLA